MAQRTDDRGRSLSAFSDKDARDRGRVATLLSRSFLIPVVTDSAIDNLAGLLVNPRIPGEVIPSTYALIAIWSADKTIRLASPVANRASYRVPACAVRRLANFTAPAAVTAFMCHRPLSSLLVRR